MSQMVEKNIKSNTPSKDILLKKDGAFEIAVQLSNTGVTNDSNGRKIIKAGTPIGGDDLATKTRNAVLKVCNSSTLGAKAQGVVRNDVDVTSGTVTATMVVLGVVDSSKCPTIDATVETALKGNILFVNGGRA